MDNILIKPSTFNFQELVNGNTCNLTFNSKSKMIDILNENFTQQQSRWFIANFYACLMYHPTTDFPINIETVYKLIGFANKAHAKRALVNNFIKDEDYKILLTPKGERVHGGQNEEEILLNVDTFKNLCMIIKTDKAKEIRKYYIKLENIFNKISKEQLVEERKEFEEKLKEKDNLLKIKEQESIKKQQDILLNSYNNKRVMYLIRIFKNLYKFGYSDNIKRRFQEHIREIGQDIELVYCIESKNNIKLENDFKSFIREEKIRKEKIINNKLQTELIETDNLTFLTKTLETLNKSIQEDRFHLENENLKLKLESINKEFKQDYINKEFKQDYILNLENDNLKLNIEKLNLENINKDFNQGYNILNLEIENLKLKLENINKEFKQKNILYLEIEKLKLDIEKIKVENINKEIKINNELQDIPQNSQEHIKQYTKQADKEHIEQDIEQDIEQEIEQKTEKDIEDIKQKDLDKTLIYNLPENTIEELEFKRQKLEELKKQNARNRVKKYRKTEKYRIKVQSEEFRKKENERNKLRSTTEQYKKNKLEYYKKNKEIINKKKVLLNKKNCKTTLIKTEEEFNKFKNWLDLNIKQESKSKLIWGELIEKYLGNKTSPLVSSVYKEYFIKYESEKYPNTSVKYYKFKVNSENKNGFNNFCLNKN